MAAQFTVASPGQVNAAGDQRALYLKMFAGEVLGAFAEQNLAMSRTLVRSISSGKSASFPATWKATAGYHTPGAEITGQAMSNNERIITIDDLLVSSVFLANIDEALSHYDVRSEYSKQAGAALARTMDKNILAVGINAARAAATITPGAGQPATNGGTVITSANAKTVVADLENAILEAAQALDEKDVPEQDRYCFVKPDQYYLLLTSSKLVHMDYASGTGNGNGIIDGKVRRIGGMELVKTNNLPSATVNAVAGQNNTYSGLFNTTAALCMHRSAVGTVKLVDLAVESDYLVQNQGTLLVAKLAVGHGILRPESAVEVRTGTPA